MTASAPTLIKVTSATFKGKALVGAQSASISIQGSAQGARGDGAQARQIQYVEDIHAQIALGVLVGLISDKDGFMPGSGALVIVGYEQIAGAGAGGTAHTWTFPVATLENANRNIPLEGNPLVNLQFTAVAPSGDPADIYSIT